MARIRIAGDWKNWFRAMSYSKTGERRKGAAGLQPDLTQPLGPALGQQCRVEHHAVRRDFHVFHGGRYSPPIHVHDGRYLVDRRRGHRRSSQSTARQV
jgi:hypothetical protein